jgi:hypothetical protein
MLLTFETASPPRHFTLFELFIGTRNDGHVRHVVEIFSYPYYLPCLPI